jgi:heme-degrading monooxygenase HmoA
MIIREWRGLASSSSAEAYPKHFRDEVVPELRRVPGFLGAHLGQRQLGDKVEFLIITRWQSMDTIRAFAGADVEEGVVEPDAVAVAALIVTSVQHYKVIEEVLVPEASVKGIPRYQQSS